MTNEDKINNWFKKFEHRLHADVPDIVAYTASTYFKERFKYENWDNVPWKQLNPKYKAKKTRGKERILYASSNLQASIHPSTISPARVTISAGNAKVPYARIHNEGLRVVGNFKVKAYTNTDFMGKGKPRKIKAHTRRVNYKMPKRQFMGHSAFLNAIIKDRLINNFNK